MSGVPEVTTGDKIKGKLKEGFGKVTGDKQMKEEGKAVHKVEKNGEKVEKQQDKVIKQHEKVTEHAIKGGVDDPNNVGVGEKLGGMVKEGLGSLTGNKSMEKEGAAVRKTEESAHKAEKERDKLCDKQVDLNKERLKAGI